jgi:molybdate transport system substrate-binding protein
MKTLRSGLLGLLLSVLAPCLRAQDVPAIAAASDLRYALDEVLTRFQRDTGRSARVSYGSSGVYTAQIRQGAPFELFLSADEHVVFQLHEAGRTEDRGQLYAVGRLVLFAPAGAGWTPDPEFRGLAAARDAKTLRRFAIANPEHAPYGRAAEQALRRTGLWDAMRPQLVFGENVSQAAQFAASGSAQGGLLAYSLVLAPAFRAKGAHVLVPEHLHEPLRQRMVLVRGAGQTARALHQYLQQPTARGILERYGFVIPADR